MPIKSETVFLSPRKNNKEENTGWVSVLYVPSHGGDCEGDPPNPTIVFGIKEKVQVMLSPPN